MRTTGAVLFVFALAASFLLSPLTVKAEVQPIVVPDDYATISLAIKNVVDGGSIYVKAGTYAETLIIDKALSLKGESTQTTIINGDNSGTVILIRHDNVEITGFSIIYDETPNTPKPYWMWSTRLIGIHLLSVKNCNIQGNKLSDCGAGIWLYDSQNNRISENNIFRCDYGVRVEISPSNTISSNLLNGNWGGLWLLSSTANKLRANAMTGNVRNFGLAGSNMAAYVNDVDTSNTVDSRPIYYWTGIADQIVPSDAGCVVLTNCKNIAVRGLRLTKVQDAITLAHCWNSTVTDNVITECNSGVTLFNSTYDRISGNNIESPVGIYASGNGTTINGNTIRAIGTGIFMEGNYQTVTGNTVDAGTFGAGNKILECKGSYNNISQNTLNGQTYVGVLVEGSHNLMYQNTITNGGLRLKGDSNLIANNTVTHETISVTGGPGNTICGNRIIDGYDLGVNGQYDSYYANHVETNGLGARIGGNEANVHNNIIFHNNFIISTRTGPVWGVNRANSWDNGSEGNYWSDYNGTDANNDGIGDTPYPIMSETLDETIRAAVPVVIGYDNYPLMAPIDIATASVELPAIEIPRWEYEELPSTPNQENPEIEPIGPPIDEPTLPSQERNQTQDPEETEHEDEPFPTGTVAAVSAASASISVATASLLLIIRRRRRKEAQRK